MTLSLTPLATINTGRQAKPRGSLSLSIAPAESRVKNLARLIAKVYEVDLLKCEECGFDLKIIAFIKDSISITKILTHLGEAVEAPKMQCARGPPEAYQIEEEWAGAPEPEYHYDQTESW